MTSSRVIVVAAMLGFAMGASGCLTTALVGLCISGCGAGCVGALGTCPIADDDNGAPAPSPVEVAPPAAAASTSEGAHQG